MDPSAVRRGFLYLQLQQTFGGKKWRRFGAALFPESGCALARLELQEGPEKPRRGEARRVIRLSDCLRVGEAGVDAPRDTSAFVLETRERQYLLAAPCAEREGWMQDICLLAFPGLRKEVLGPEAKVGQPCMAENELYGSQGPVAPCKAFAVTVRRTEASERCRLRGAYRLRAGDSALELWGGPEPSTLLYNWPYRFLRRFGRDKVTFSFEAGRRCDSGEGTFEFETRQVVEIFQALDQAIAVQKKVPPAGLQAQVPAVLPVALPRPESPYARPHDSLPPPSPTVPVPTVPVPMARPRSTEGEYAVPFDAVARKLGKSLRGILAAPPPAPSDPLYDSIQEEQAPRGPDHIYDEPEGVAARSLYDRPQEPHGEAWRMQNEDWDLYPGGQGPCGDGWAQGAEYDNVVLRKGPK